jgi:ribosome-associated protein
VARKRTTQRDPLPESSSDTKQQTESKTLALEAVAAAFTKNAYAPVLLDVAAVSSYTDLILVVSGRSTRQVEAIAEAIQQGLKEQGHDPLGVEGERGGQWYLLDYADVVIHVFFHPMREHYDLEGLWSEAARIELDVPPELRVVPMAYSASP